MDVGAHPTILKSNYCMKKIISLLVFVSHFCCAQQDISYKLKSNSKSITKAQVDSLLKAHGNNLQYTFSQEKGKTVVEVDVPSSQDQSTSTNDPGTQFRAPSKSLYKDTLGKVIGADAFKEKTRSGKYSFMYSMSGDTTTFLLVNKKKAEKEAADQLSAFKNKLVGKPFPYFKLKKLDGTEIDLTSLKGKTVVFNFWFIGCKPCVAEMPLLNEVVNHYKDRSDIFFLAPAPDESDKLTSFLLRHSFLYQALSSAQDLIKKLDISSYPTHVIVDPQGLIKEVMVGGRDDIDKLLKDAINKVAEE